jgi:hypothetical protein
MKKKKERDISHRSILLSFLMCVAKLLILLMEHFFI